MDKWELFLSYHVIVRVQKCKANPSNSESLNTTTVEINLRKEEYAAELINMKSPKYPRKTKVANDCGVV